MQYKPFAKWNVLEPQQPSHSARNFQNQINASEPLKTVVATNCLRKNQKSRNFIRKDNMNKKIRLIFGEQSFEW